jgi:hypothetical protein
VLDAKFPKHEETLMVAFPMVNHHGSLSLLDMPKHYDWCQHHGAKLIDASAKVTMHRPPKSQYCQATFTMRDPSLLPLLKWFLQNYDGTCPSKHYIVKDV